MRKGYNYKHQDCIDMVIECLRCVPVPKGFKVKVKYLILGADKRTLHDTLEKEEVLITKDQIRNWRVWRPETNEKPNEICPAVDL